MLKGGEELFLRVKPTVICEVHDRKLQHGSKIGYPPRNMLPNGMGQKNSTLACCLPAAQILNHAGSVAIMNEATSHLCRTLSRRSEQCVLVGALCTPLSSRRARALDSADLM